MATTSNQDSEHGSDSHRADSNAELDLDAELLQMPAPGASAQRRNVARSQDKGPPFPPQQKQQHHPQHETKAKPAVIESPVPKLEEQPHDPEASTKQKTGIKRSWSEVNTAGTPEGTQDASPTVKRQKPIPKVASGALGGKPGSEVDILSNWGVLNKEQPAVIPTQTAATEPQVASGMSREKKKSSLTYLPSLDKPKASLKAFGNHLQQFQESCQRLFAKDGKEKKDMVGFTRTQFGTILQILEDQGQTADRLKAMDHLQTVIGASRVALKFTWRHSHSGSLL